MEEEARKVVVVVEPRGEEEVRSGEERAVRSGGSEQREARPFRILPIEAGNLKPPSTGSVEANITKARPNHMLKPGSLLSTECGSPSYVAPEELNKKTYDGAAAYVWACGVILFELCVGYLPFTDPNLLNLYTKIISLLQECYTDDVRAVFEPEKVMTIYKKHHSKMNMLTKCQGFFFQGSSDEKIFPETQGFINAFQLIAMSSDLDLSTLFEDTMKIQLKSKFRSSFSLLVEVIEVAPTNCVVEVPKPAEEAGIYKEVFSGFYP
ncbi:CBL-interacting serine/threonine-protein kinase 21-like [Spinacia oleracea]|uniref:non-specific serine/threonine protein kinase n=1 Tax=Spinacia oleracea TaxID=3562 RepID=A0ABM3QZE5_SPIOL|nr:CBL-interacting serine/threonine-protein kinase 21-like [Spinacia oleracea]